MRLSFLLFGLCPAVIFAATVPLLPPAHINKFIDATLYMAGGNGTVPESTGLQKRTAGNVYLCNDPGFTGYCVLITGATDGECVELASDLADLVSSFGPDAGQTCYLFRNARCLAGAFSDILQDITAPGISDLSVMGFDNVASSYICVFDGGPPLTVSFPS